MPRESERVAERVRALLDRPGEPPRADEPSAVVALSRGAAHRAPGLARRLVARIPVRANPGRRAALAAGAAVIVAGALSAGWVMSARPQAVPVSGASPSRASAPLATLGRTTPASRSASPPASSRPATLVVVDVSGKVRRPGLYRLAAGSRIDDAVRAAGGALPGVSLDSLNLASRVSDGQQIAVGVAAAASVPTAGSGGRAGGPSAAVDLNTADAGQLQTLPGVGPVLAQHVLDWRAAHGPFASVDQLNDVPGIGEVKFAALRPLVTVS